MSKNIFIASDHAGLQLKNTMVEHLEAKGWQITDLGTHSKDSCHYPLMAHKLCEQVLETGQKGILICGTGIGMSIAANRYAGIRAALCVHEFHAKATRQHNDANVLCLGERVTAPGLACLIADIFLSTPFESGRHLERINLIEKC